MVSNEYFITQNDKIVQFQLFFFFNLIEAMTIFPVEIC